MRALKDLFVKLGRRESSLAILLLASLIGGSAAPRAQEVVIPYLWDPKARLERPDLAPNRTVRFIVDDEFPPLNFPGPDGNPTGFAVEIARAACERLGLTCTVQARRFDTLLDALAEGRGDVVAAAIPATAAIRERFAVTTAYHRTPARFADRKDRNQPIPSPAGLTGKTVGVVAGTAHEAYLTTFFTSAKAQVFPTLNEAQGALRRGEVDYVFADGLALALYVGGAEAEACCALIGGPYLESRYFGEGIGFILREEDETLRRAFDYAIQRLADEGKYAELYLRFFPIGPY